MSNTINLFMWGWQQVFQILAKARAEDLFRSLDKDFTPQLFLVGFLQTQRTDRHPICLEPEDCGYIPSDFQHVVGRIPHFQTIDEQANFFHSDPSTHRDMQKRIEVRAATRALKEALETHQSGSDFVFFVSAPALIEDFRVFVVLQLPKIQWEKHYRLQITTDRWGRSVFAASLLDAVVDQFLAACHREFFLPEPGRNFGSSFQTTDIIRSGGRGFLQSTNYRLGAFSVDLFAVCNGISSLRYEGAEGVGRIILARREHPNVDVALSLLSPVPISNLRAIRKLLEITGEEVVLLSDGEHIYGLGAQVGIYDDSREDLFCINFTKHFHWELVHDQEVMMQVAYENPRLPRLRLDEQKFRADIPRIFPGTTEQEIENLWQLVLSAIDQRHGTMVVISTDAKVEAERLSNQCISIAPKPLTPKMMDLVTNIDGSVLIDPQSTCYAIGVILDGLASQNGTSARGARYNSAIRYMENRSGCLIIVVSEDGSIDLIPDLRPQLSRSLIRTLLDDLRAVEQQTNVDEEAFGKAVSRLEKIRFYLNQDQCDEVNQLRQHIEAKIPKEANRLYIVHQELVLHPDFNETYLID